MRTTGNMDNGHFSLSRVTNSHILSTSLYGHWLSAHCLGGGIFVQSIRIHFSEFSPNDDSDGDIIEVNAASKEPKV